jgi:hypothetical protein
MSTSSSEVSFKQYGGNAAENYERYFVPRSARHSRPRCSARPRSKLVSASSTSHAAQVS